MKFAEYYQTQQLGVLCWRWQWLNQNDIDVLDLEATRFFELSPE